MRMTGTAQVAFTNGSSAAITFDNLADLEEKLKRACVVDHGIHVDDQLRMPRSISMTVQMVDDPDYDDIVLLSAAEKQKAQPDEADEAEAPPAPSTEQPVHEQPAGPALVGSDMLPGTIAFTDKVALTAGELVQSACLRSELAAEQWNALNEPVRDALLRQEVENIARYNKCQVPDLARQLADQAAS